MAKINPGDTIGKIGNDLVHREKFKRPIVMCAVAANGSVLAGDYPRRRLPVQLELFCERPVLQKMETPLNVFYIDAEGRVARAIMDDAGVQISIDEPTRKRKTRRREPRKDVA